METKQTLSHEEYRGERYVIRYLYTEDIARPAIEYYWLKESKFWPCMIGVILGLLMLLWTRSIVFLLIIAEFVFLAVFWKTNGSRGVKQWRIANSVYYEEQPEVTVEISDKVYFSGGIMNFSLSFDKFQGFYDVDLKEMVLVDKAKRLIILPRSGFEEGEYGDCKMFLHAQMKQLFQ